MKEVFIIRQEFNLGDEVYVLLYEYDDKVVFDRDLSSTLDDIYFIKCLVKGAFMNDKKKIMYDLHVVDNNIMSCMGIDNIDIDMVRDIINILAYTPWKNIFGDKKTAKDSVLNIFYSNMSMLESRFSQSISGIDYDTYIKYNHSTMIEYIHNAIIGNVKVESNELLKSRRIFYMPKKIEFKLSFDREDNTLTVKNYNKDESYDKTIKLEKLPLYSEESPCL